MPVTTGTIPGARRATLKVAEDLIGQAIGALDAGNVEYADTVIVTVLRVLDAYEAVTQLTPGGISRIDENAAIGLHPVRDRDA